MTIEEFVPAWGVLLASYPLATNARGHGAQQAYYSAFKHLPRCAWEQIVDLGRETLDHPFPTVAALKFLAPELHECDRCRGGPKPKGIIRSNPNGPFDSPEEEERVIQVVRANQRNPGKNPIAYVVRIAEQAGLMAKGAEPAKAMP